MKSNVNLGDKRIFRVVVKDSDTAAFEGNEVHPFYATFALARDAEWCGRLFVLDMKDADEEGIGTFVNVKHLSPALVGEEVVFTAEVIDLESTSLVCKIDAFVGDRQIAECETGQKVLKKTKLKALKKELRGG